ADEVGLWRKWEKAWDESIAFAVRLDPAVIVATGTPKAGHGLVKRLINGDPELGLPPADLVTKMRMADNIDNLSKHQVDRLMARYGDTSLGRQELEGELLDEVEGALWSLRLIDESRMAEPGLMARVVVGVDPQGSAESGTTGIVAAGITRGDCPCGG